MIPRSTLNGNAYMRKITFGLLSVSMLLAAGAPASTATHNQLGYAHKIIAGGTTMTVEIRLKPKRSFDSVTVEAGSGVASLSPDCSFSALTAGGSYVCRFDVTGKSTDAAMTINIVAESRPSPHALVETEVHHLTITNSGFARPAAGVAASRHTLMSSGASAK
jgi:hypothetical protein